MQVALNLAAAAAPLPLFSSVTPNAHNPSNCKLPTSIPSSNKLATSTIGGLRSSSSSYVKANAAAMPEPETADYNSTFSVFPAEACETIGGDACLADVYPEVKLLQTEGTTRTSTTPTSELVDRDYLQYNDPKTVLLGEACDVLGGEFCERPYQTGIF